MVKSSVPFLWCFLDLSVNLHLFSISKVFVIFLPKITLPSWIPAYKPFYIPGIGIWLCVCFNSSHIEFASHNEERASSRERGSSNNKINQRSNQERNNLHIGADGNVQLLVTKLERESVYFADDAFCSFRSFAFGLFFEDCWVHGRWKGIQVPGTGNYFLFADNVGFGLYEGRWKGDIRNAMIFLYFGIHMTVK